LGFPITKAIVKSGTQKTLVPEGKLPHCRRCPRMRHQFKKLRISHPDYWNAPVPASGQEDSPLLIVGLAPGMHGANRTGVPFTGDASGDLIFKALDALDIVQSVRITNAVKCLPVQNSPNGNEINNCQPFLREELSVHLKRPAATLFILGGVAHRAVLKALDLKLKDYPFSHGEVNLLPGSVTMISSYHCSRYNTQTGRLTEPMFMRVIRQAASTAGLLASPNTQTKT
jgi:uracil-DNA glycosylase family 4